MRNAGVMGRVLVCCLVTVPACALEPDAQDVDESVVEADLAKPGSDPGDPPSAAGCGTTGPLLDGRTIFDATVSGAANQRSGSSTGCTALGALQASDDAVFYCWTIGNDLFSWTYLRNTRTGVRGWVRGDLLDNGGADINAWCGF